MSRTLRTLWSLLCALWLLLASASASAQTQAKGATELEMGGVVTSQPLTPFGQWFHAGFTQNWNAHADVEGYQLLIKERLLPRGGTEVQIFSGENLVYRSALPRNPVQILALSEAAVEQAYQNAVEQGLQTLLFRDADLSNSGI